MIYRNVKNGREQFVVRGSDLAEAFRTDDDWQPVDQQSAKPSTGANLDRHTRKELNAVAAQAGVENPERFKSKPELLKAIRDQQSG